MTTNALSEYLDKAKLPTVGKDAMASAMAESVADAPDSDKNSGGTQQYLTFTGKYGRYALGRAKDPVDPEDLYIMEPQSLFEGWVCWKGGKPIDRHRWSIYERNEKAVDEDDLKDHGPYDDDQDGWKFERGFGVLDTTTLHEAVSFASSSISGRNSVSDLIDAIRTRVLAGEPDMPVIHFDMEEFEGQGKKNFKPTFPVEAWVTRDAVANYLTEGGMSLEDLLDGKAPKKLAAKSRRRKAA